MTDELTNDYKAVQAFAIEHKLVTAEGLKVGDSVSLTPFGAQLVSILTAIHLPDLAYAFDSAVVFTEESPQELKDAIQRIYPEEIANVH